MCLILSVTSLQFICGLSVMVMTIGIGADFVPDYVAYQKKQTKEWEYV